MIVMIVTKVIFYFIILAIIAILVGANIRLNQPSNINSKLINGEQCKGGICPPLKGDD